jgi:transposase InsO family protein
MVWPHHDQSHLPRELALLVTLNRTVDKHPRWEFWKCFYYLRLNGYSWNHRCESNGVELRFIQPGKPNQNAFIEKFNRTFRSEVLNAYIFESLEEVREIAWWRMIAYNEERPHDALGGLPPSVFRKRLKVETFTFELST